MESKKPDLSKDKVKFKGEYLNIQEHDGWYEYAKGTGTATGVSVVISDSENDKVLVRHENCPIHFNGVHPTSLTGMIDEGYTATETAIKEVEEESGYRITEDDLVYCGWVYASKSSVYIHHLFYVDLKGYADDKKHEGHTDGTQGEVDSYCDWQDIAYTMENIYCPTFSTTIMRYIGKETMGVDYGKPEA